MHKNEERKNSMCGAHGRCYVLYSHDIPNPHNGPARKWRLREVESPGQGHTAKEQ